MGWRMKLAGVAVLAGGIGAGALYLRDTARIPAAQDAGTYNESAAFKLPSGQTIQLRVARCDLGATGRQRIVKVYGEASNLAPTAAPRHEYRFFARDGNGRLYDDRVLDETPGANAFSLLAGEKRAFTMKFLVDPGALDAAIDLVAVGHGSTNALIRLKSAQPLDLRLPDGEWRKFSNPRW